MVDSIDKTLDETLDMVAVPKKEYEGLLKAGMWLDALEQAGVDNWSGIGYAYELLQEREDT